MDYKFNPLKYGFEPVDKFPELMEHFGVRAFIKVSAVGEKKHFGRLVYWYIACYPLNPEMHSDDRIKIVSHSFDIESKQNFTEFSRPTTKYNGLISTDEFAVDLLSHILGALPNSSVKEYGVHRLITNLNKEVHDFYKS